MSVDEQFAMCPVCKVTYRPGMEGSRRGHHTALGHWPPDEAVRRPEPPPAAEDDPPPPTPGELVEAAARRGAVLEAVIAGLDELASSWERHGPPADPAAMLRGYLARPPIHALDEEEPDG
ncbi:hypothetical protein [Isoptericola sp. NPDC058082]|uniref:hypothetical protein n=1 Tax=Isoptericola sp. NPDC058082 TaxID=3346331 RepID=UPI0036E676F5